MFTHTRPAAVFVLAGALVGGARLVGQNVKDPAAAALKNPVASTPASVGAGKRAYDLNCAGCHGNRAQGAQKAGITISIIQEQGGKQPPDLTDAVWDHGSTDGDHQEGRAADDDGRMGRPHLRH
jgi:cytochrome c